MAAVKIQIYRGTTYNITYKHQDSTGAVVPLTGKTVYFTVKAAEYDSSSNDATAAIKKTITSHSDPANGMTAWTINDADTEIDPGKYYFDVVVEDSATHLSDPPSMLGTLVVLPKQTNRNVGNE